MSHFWVLDRTTKAVLYEGESLAQAKGFTDGYEGATIIATVTESCRSEWLYQIQLRDEASGQVVAQGPTVDLSTAADLLGNLRVVVMPIDHEYVKGGAL